MAANNNKATALTLPSVQAFSRKLEVSDALMTSGLWTDIDKSDQWKPISLHEKRNRATKSQFGAKDEEKKEPNLSWGDDASLPHDADTLRIKYSLKILGRLEEPTACNTPVFEEKVVEIVNAYRTEHQFKELATRYANNIVNGRFLWRNRVGAESVSIKVQHGKQTWLFDAYNYPLNKFSSSNDSNHSFGELIAVIKNGCKVIVLSI
jgi:CRISPR-associated protein Csy3